MNEGDLICLNNPITDIRKCKTVNDIYLFAKLGNSFPRQLKYRLFLLAFFRQNARRGKEFRKIKICPESC